MIKKIKKDIYNNRYVIILVLAYLLFMEIVFHEMCPIKAIFKINCPGCGLTHAFFYLLTGRLKDAIYANYSIFLWLPLIILLFINRYIKKLNKYVIPIFFGLTAIVTIARYILLFLK